MKLLNNTETFDSLNNTRHRIIQDGQFSLFPEMQSDTPKQDSEYWYFSDIHNTYNNENTPIYNIDMNSIAEKNIYMPTDLTKNHIKLVPCNFDFLQSHTKPIKHAYKMGNIEYKKATDLQLSRYACWCILRHTPDNMFTYTYFISPAIKENITFDELENISYQFARAPERSVLTRLNQRFNGIVTKLNGTAKILNTQKIKTFFDNHNSQTLKSAYGITDTKLSLLDFMGANSMHYMIDGLSATLSIASNPKRCTNINQFEEIMYNQLNKARQEMIQQTGIKPENDIQKTNIISVQKELHRAENEFIKRYSNTKLR
ncbi:MAG: hypothetical protein IKL14_04960 [Alphaproteobacteria bacterium]|nr:hypothetical protein [Alphaproteobacteria bacterium]